MSDIGAGFPKPLAHNYLKRLQGNFSKNTIRIIPDNQTATPNNTIRFKVSGSGLFNLQSFQMYMTGTCKQDAVATENYKIHFPRYASSLIQDIVITANNTTLFSCKEYNYLYNKIHDLEANDISQFSKRNCMGDNIDPSVSATISSKDESSTTNQSISLRTSVLSTTPSDTDVPLCVNNWLFFNSLSCPVIDLSSIGDLYIVISFSGVGVLWRSASTGTASTTLTNPTYTLSNIYATIDRYQLSDPLYYQLLTEKLLGDGLMIGFHDYYFNSFSQIKKKSGVSLNWSVNSACLDKVYMAFKHNLSSSSSVYPLCLFGYNKNVAQAEQPDDGGKTVAVEYLTFLQLLSNWVKTDNDGAGTDIEPGMDKLGDLYNQSVYFISSGANIATSRWSINSVDIDTYNVPPIELFNKYLKHDNFANLDSGSGCVAPYFPTLYHYLKYGFVDTLDLTMQTGNDPNMWVSGLSGMGQSINISYNATFDTAADTNITPVAWARSTRILKVQAGRVLQIDPPVVY